MSIIHGFICDGADNHMVKHPDALVRRARLLHARGYLAAEIREHLRDEGYEINRNTIQTWVKRVTRDDALIAEVENEVRAFLAELDSTVSKLTTLYQEAA